MIFPAIALACVALAPWQSTDEIKWQPVAPEGAGFEVLMPAEPKTAARKMKPLPGRTITVHLTSATIKDGKALFMVAYHDLDFDPVGDEKIRDILDGGIKGSLLNCLGKLSKHERITLGEYPGRHFEYAGARFDQKIQAVSRIYLVGRRVVQITVIRDPAVNVEAETTKFFESFKIAAKSAAPVEPFSSGESKAAPADKPKTGEKK